jgi:hypothetical protein
MSANEATRLRADDEHRAVGREEESAARPLARGNPEPAAAASSPEATAVGESVRDEPSTQSLDELERAAENIRPSWHGAEVEVAANGAVPGLGNVPAPLPPPPALPSFSSFPIEQRAPLYSADSTVRTAAVLPERLSQLLNQPQIAHASHWLRGRPWAIAALAVSAVILLALLLWPSAEPQHMALPPPVSAAPRAPAPPAPVAPSAAPTPAPDHQASSGAAASKASANEPSAPAPVAKKRDKRAGRAAAKTAAPKGRKPAKTVGSPAAAR